MKKITIKEGDFAICLIDYLILRRPKKIQEAKKIKSGKEMEILIDIRRKTVLYYMKQCLNSKKFALLLAKKMKMNLLLITENDGLTICCFVNKSRRLSSRGFFYFCYNV